LKIGMSRKWILHTWIQNYSAKSTNGNCIWSTIFAVYSNLNATAFLVFILNSQ
jgi:hypothetical protein